MKRLTAGDEERCSNEAIESNTLNSSSHWMWIIRTLHRIWHSNGSVLVRSARLAQLPPEIFQYAFSKKLQSPFDVQIWSGKCIGGTRQPWLTANSYDCVASAQQRSIIIDVKTLHICIKNKISMKQQFFFCLFVRQRKIMKTYSTATVTCIQFNFVRMEQVHMCMCLKKCD